MIIRQQRKSISIFNIKEEQKENIVVILNEIIWWKRERQRVSL
jgi:hypothetical protein